MRSKKLSDKVNDFSAIGYWPLALSAGRYLPSSIAKHFLSRIEKMKNIYQ